MDTLHCPMCEFAVPQSDDYVLQLHFEQIHTEDSPFRIEDDPEPLPPRRPPLAPGYFPNKSEEDGRSLSRVVDGSTKDVALGRLDQPMCMQPC